MTRKRSRFPNLTTIRTVPGLMKAQVFKTKLESAGIPVLLDYESAGQIYGITVDGLGQVRIMVPQDRAEEARDLLQEEEPAD